MPISINCQICGQEFLQKSIVITEIEGKFIYTCPNCYGLLFTCYACEYAQNCNFKNDTSEPHLYNKTIHQDPMTMTIPIKNPNLIQKHCSVCRCGTINGQTVDCERERENGLHCPNCKIESNLLR